VVESRYCLLCDGAMMDGLTLVIVFLCDLVSAITHYNKINQILTVL
jgi:hypothetical protein